MNFTLTLFFAAFALFLVLQLWRLRRRLRAIEAAVRERKPLLAENEGPLLCPVGLKHLIRETNELIEESRNHSEIEARGPEQVEATLSPLQEATLIFDRRRRVEFANEAAKRLFQSGIPLVGARLEAILRSTSLLEFLDGANGQGEGEGGDPENGQIQLERGGRTLWFEASRADVRSLNDPRETSTLLVLHDVTRLKQLEMVRRDFVANVSHELRTPLTIIKGFGETLLEDNASLPEQSRARFLQKIVHNSGRLHLLVEDLLTLSRLESKPEQIQPAPNSLKELFEETRENHESRLDPEKQKFVLTLDPGIGLFSFDRFRIQQVFENLVENVFRYAPSFTALELRARLDANGEYVCCAVIDDGPGIPAKDLEYIFQRFYRVDKGRSRERGGTGLGLSIAKHIVQLHGGSIRAESGGEGGTAIHFTLPYRREEAAHPA